LESRGKRGGGRGGGEGGHLEQLFCGALDSQHATLEISNWLWCWWAWVTVGGEVEEAAWGRFRVRLG
jgi:hypothetical protein